MCENMVWMPYHRIRFEYTRSEKGLIRRYGETGQGETALNAMFCECVESERELFVLFRPNYLKYKVMKYSPQLEEVVGPTFHTDFDELLGGFARRLNEIKAELIVLRSELKKSRMRVRRYSWIIPATSDLKKERELSEKVAKLDATKYTLNMCLNVNESINSIKVMDSDIFYYPILVVTLRNKENGTQRYVVVNLAENESAGEYSSFDRALTALGDKNSECKGIIARSIVS